MSSERLVLRGVICLLLLTTFFLGVPSFHYTVALMVALLVRYRDDPAGLLAPIDYSLPVGRLRAPLLARARNRYPRR